MNKDQYWHKVIRERPELQAGPATTITLTVLDVRRLVKDAYEAGAACAVRRKVAVPSPFDKIFGTH